VTNSNSVLILGAKSQLSKSIARKFSDKGFNLVLAGRNISSLINFSKEIKLKNNINCSLQEFDILNKNDHDNFFKNIKDIPDYYHMCYRINAKTKFRCRFRE
jgi:short-subunit dehydrogenase